MKAEVEMNSGVCLTSETKTDAEKLGFLFSKKISLTIKKLCLSGNEAHLIFKIKHNGVKG